MKKQHLNPMLSIVVPVYNAEKYLKCCIESILGQTYKNLEVILVDDGSTDRSGEICDYYKSVDNRVSVIHKKNGGIVSARKAGIVKTSGRYVTCVDSDDWIESNMYEEMMYLIEKHNAEIVTSGLIRDYENHYILEYEDICPGFYEKEMYVDNVLKKMIATDSFFKGNLSMHIYNKIYDHDLFLKYQLKVDDKINIGEDAACVYPCLLNAKSLVVTGKNYYHYCIKGTSVMDKKVYDEQERYKVLFLYLEEECKNHIKKVSNIMMQIKFLQYYCLLLQKADKVICYKNNILFPFGKIKKGEKIIIYGAGRFGRELKQLLEEIEICNIVGWIDKNEKENVKSIKTLEKIKYDKILVAVAISDIASKIKKELIKMSIDERKIYIINYQMIRESIIYL